MGHPEIHRTQRIGWLRAAVLGANDGIVSTASLVLGVASSGAGPQAVLVAGVAGLVAGALSMAAGEYVSVSSQSDTERADLAREREELATAPEQEQAELAAIYVRRGLEPELATTVAAQLMRHDALGAHARDELGISKTMEARPVQAAFASARNVLDRCRTTAIDCASAAGFHVHVGGPGKLAAVSGAAWFTGSKNRRRSNESGCSSSDVLGCPGHGIDRWCWRAIWRGRLTMPAT